MQRVENLSYRCATTSPSIDVITDLRPPSVLHRVATKPQFPPYALYGMDVSAVREATAFAIEYAKENVSRRPRG